MSLREYADWWRQHKAGTSVRLLYLKDWHFVSEFPGYQVCRTPWPGHAGCLAHLPFMRSPSLYTKQSTIERNEAAVESTGRFLGFPGLMHVCNH